MALTESQKNPSIWDTVDAEEIFGPPVPPDLQTLRLHYNLHPYVLADAVGYHVPTECVEEAFRIRSGQSPLPRCDSFELSPFGRLEATPSDADSKDEESSCSPLVISSSLNDEAGDLSVSISPDDEPEREDTIANLDSPESNSDGAGFEHGSGDASEDSDNDPEDDTTDGDDNSHDDGEPSDDAPSSTSHAPFSHDMNGGDAEEGASSSSPPVVDDEQNKDSGESVDSSPPSDDLEDAGKASANSPDETSTAVGDGDDDSRVSSLTPCSSRATTPTLVSPSRSPSVFIPPGDDGDDGDDNYRVKRSLKRKRTESENSADRTARRRRSPPKVSSKAEKVSPTLHLRSRFLTLGLRFSSSSGPHLGNAFRVRRRTIPGLA